MKILITGGAGFIGSNFIRYILNKYPEYKIINLDKLTYCGNLENLKDIQNNPNYRFIKGDICDSDVVNDIVKNCDTIINFAAQTHVDRSIIDSSEFIRTNISGTNVLLEAAKKHSLDKFIQISTDETYGSIEKGSFTEDSPLKPNSPYAATKASADLLCRAYLVTYKLPVIIIRSCNNFGPYQYPEKVIPLFVTNALDNKKLPLYGDGLNVRDWLYVLDTCQAIDLVLHKGETGQIYNVAAGNERANLELTKLILKMMGKTEDLIEYAKDRPGHDRRYGASWSRIKGLGWQPQYQFQQALRETIKWYQDNQEWWRKLKS
jgi:dTDP-glucose 4,6-dehydratase